MRYGSAFLLLLVCGCQREPVVAPPGEASLAEQIAAVRIGRETGIVVEQTPLSNEDLTSLDGLNNLTTLCVDHPESRITAAGIAKLRTLPKLEHLRIRSPGIGDEAIANLVELRRLKILNLPRAEFTNDGLARLQELPDLDFLRFSSPHVTDAGIQAMLTFPSLQRLHLIDVPITDVGLAKLAEIDALQSLYIDGGSISDAAWDELFRRRPKLHVHINQQHHDRDPHKHAH
jgi:hypothetical protein